jgi:hypothetical protein
MRGDIDEIGFRKSAVDFFCPLFLVFYLTPDHIFVNRLGLPAKSRDLQPGHIPK